MTLHTNHISMAIIRVARPTTCRHDVAPKRGSTQSRVLLPLRDPQSSIPLPRSRASCLTHSEMLLHLMYSDNFPTSSLYPVGLLENFPANLAMVSGETNKKTLAC